MDKIKALVLKYKEQILYVFFGGLTTLINWGAYALCYNVRMYLKRGCFASGYSWSAVQILSRYSTVNTATDTYSNILNTVAQLSAMPLNDSSIMERMLSRIRVIIVPSNRRLNISPSSALFMISNTRFFSI